MRQLSKYDAPGLRARGCQFWASILLCVLLLGGASPGCHVFGGADHPNAPARFEQMVGQAPVGQAATNSGTLWYQLEVAPNRLMVHIRLLKPPRRTTFFLPAQWAGSADYADAIQIHGARVPDGLAPYTIDRSSGRIEVESNQARWVQLDYSVALSPRTDHFSRFHPRFADQLFFAYGPAFLILPSAQIIDTIRDIPIEIHAPSDWQMLSTWSAHKRSPSKTSTETTVHGYLAETPAALRDAFVVGGPHLVIESIPEDASITLGFDPRIQVNREQFGASITQILGAYRQRFGELGSVSAYMRRVVSEDAQEHLGVGRHGGFVLEIRDRAPNTHGPDDAGLDPQILLLLAHEAFHMWNGHSLTPAPETEPSTRWFKEGFTHYMAIKTLAELGLFSREEILAELDKSGEHYLRNPAAGATMRRDSSAVDRARLPYDRGVLLALAIDTFLTTHSNGRLSAQDWFRALMNNLAERHQPYRAGHLRAAFVTSAEQAGASAAEAGEFWRAHVDAQRPLEPETIFRRAGLHWLNPPSQLEATEQANASQQKTRRLLRLKLANSPFEYLFPTPHTAQRLEPHVP